MRPLYKTKFPPRPQALQPQATIDIAQFFKMMDDLTKTRAQFEKDYANFVQKSREKLYDDGIVTRQKMAKMQADFEKKANTFMRDAQNQLETYKRTMAKGDKGEPGKDGNDAVPPTDDALRALIQPLIPEPLQPNEGNIVDRAVEKLKASGVIPTISDIGKVLITMLENNYFKKIWKDIEKIQTDLRQLSSRVMLGSGGGGGMGTIKYFKFSCDGGTTTFTLPDTPTQDGAAVFPRYQGQSLYPDDHFTVSGKTLTTTFTGENATFIDGFLIT